MSNIDIFKKVQKASAELNLLSESKINEILRALADAAENNCAEILAANEKDLAKMDPANPMYDRLKLTKERIDGIASDIRNVATLPSPLGKTSKENTLPNGLKIKRVSVPFGVIGIIYEARPNVTFDVFSLCLKSGNACVLKGGTDAFDSNSAIVNVIHNVLKQHDVNPDIVALMPAGREATADLLAARDYVDLLIPRGSAGLIKFVRENAKVNVIETGAGVVHTYFDKAGDLEKGKAIVNNGKTRRVSVCNALDCLIIHKDRLNDIDALCAPLAASNVKLYCDEASFAALKQYPAELKNHATADDFGCEFQDYKMAIKTVDSIDGAIDHVSTYSSKHSEAIISEDCAALAKYVQLVDAACVYQNAPTSFTDGAQFGLGAEIGISTQKLHARGPMALEEITTYKWVIEGNGQVRK